MLDLEVELEKAQKTLAQLNKNLARAPSFEVIQNISRSLHFIQLLTELIGGSPSQDNYLSAFKRYFEQTHDTTSFITAHPESDISLSLYKIAIEAGKNFSLSPFAFIFPGLLISDEDYLENLSHHGGFQEHLKAQNISDEQLPQYLSSIVQKYLCGEKTLIDKKLVFEDYLLDDNRAQRGRFKELPTENGNIFR